MKKTGLFGLSVISILSLQSIAQSPTVAMLDLIGYGKINDEKILVFRDSIYSILVTIDTIKIMPFAERDSFLTIKDTVNPFFRRIKADKIIRGAIKQTGDEFNVKMLLFDNATNLFIDSFQYTYLGLYNDVLPYIKWSGFNLFKSDNDTMLFANANNFIILEDSARPKLINSPKITYPTNAKYAEQKGRVVLEILIDINGKVNLIRVKDSSGSVLLDEAAVDGMREAVFMPCLGINKEPIKVWFTWPITFVLRK
jgi:TonB family protein